MRMTYDYARDHEHELSSEFLSPSDAEVLDIYESGNTLKVDVAVHCPQCSETLALTASVDSVTAAETTLPLDEEYYE